MLVRKLFFIILSVISLSAQAGLPTTVLEALKKAGIPQENVAVYVQALDSAMPAIQHNASKSLNPASVMKLVTTYAALEALTPDYRWKTEVYRDGYVSNGVLNGDLILKGYGDPSFKAQEFWRLLMNIQQAGIKQITGNLVIDKSLFAKEVSNRNTFDAETWRAYNAMPSAFLVNGRNTSFKFYVQDGAVKVVQEFELPQISIINKMRLRQGACGSWRNYFNYTVKTTESNLSKDASASALVTFNGTFSPECEERYLELSVLSDEQYAFATFKKLWQALGGQFNGQLKVKETPPTAIKVLSQLSDPLAYAIRDINKWSHNLMARQLMLTLGAEKLGVPANESKGAQAVKEVLSSKGLVFNELVLENGSGLSRIERVSAEHLGQLLVSAYHSPIMPELLASMPILGLDGTVKKRLESTPAQGRGHLKTGSLEGVTTIAGYVFDLQKKRHVLVMMVNHANASASKEAQDALLQSVIMGMPDN